MRPSTRPLPHSRRRWWRSATVVVALMAAVACGSDEPAADEGRVLRVGPDYATIQEAVDDARPGDMVLISPGTYAEEVDVATDRLVIRGTDRNAVVLDGEDRLLNGIEVTADQVAIENLTVRRYVINGVLFTGSYEGEDPQDGPVGWRASYVTAVNNGLYGLYAFGTGPGRFDHNYASGHPDSGIYVGQCQECGAVVVDNVAERNAIGFENTNASGVVVARNVLRSNRVGMAISSSVTEHLAPQRQASIVANLVVDNAEAATPETRGGFGVGIAVAGGTENDIRRNVVRAHAAGIVLVDQSGYPPVDNVVADNDLGDNDLAVVVATEEGGPAEVGASCVEGNGDGPTQPPGLDDLLPCGRADGPIDLGAQALDLGEAPPGIAHTEVAEPPDQPQMPGADDERWSIPAREPETVDLDAMEPPAG